MRMKRIMITILLVNIFFITYQYLSLNLKKKPNLNAKVLEDNLKIEIYINQTIKPFVDTRPEYNFFKEYMKWCLDKYHNGWIPWWSLEPCPCLNPKLEKQLQVNFTPPSWSEIHSLKMNNPSSKKTLLNCKPLYKIALVIPYRDRDSHLRIFLRHMHSFLSKQQLDYRIIVMEQADNTTFNKAALMNAAFLEIIKRWKDIECFIFHDVDMLPEDERNLYNCYYAPRHLGANVDKFNYTIAYEQLIGGALTFTKSIFIKLNGFSNNIYGYGGEDDDMWTRIGGSISRSPYTLSRYKMIKHTRDLLNPDAVYRKSSDVYRKSLYDINGINTLVYTLITYETKSFYERFKVTVRRSLEIDYRKVVGKECVDKGIRDFYSIVGQPDDCASMCSFFKKCRFFHFYLNRTVSWPIFEKTCYLYDHKCGTFNKTNTVWMYFKKLLN